MKGKLIVGMCKTKNGEINLVIFDAQLYVDQKGLTKNKKLLIKRTTGNVTQNRMSINYFTFIIYMCVFNSSSCELKTKIKKNQQTKPLNNLKVNAYIFCQKSL